MPEREHVVFEDRMEIGRKWAASLATYDIELSLDNPNSILAHGPAEVQALRHLGGIAVEFSREFEAKEIPKHMLARGAVDLSLGSERVRLTMATRLEPYAEQIFHRHHVNVGGLVGASDYSPYEAWIFPTSALSEYVPPTPTPRAPRRTLFQFMGIGSRG